MIRGVSRGEQIQKHSRQRTDPRWYFKRNQIF